MSIQALTSVVIVGSPMTSTDPSIAASLAAPGDGLRVLAVTNMWPTSRSQVGSFVRDQVESLRALGVEVDVEIVRSLRGRLDYLWANARVGRRLDAARREGRPYDLVHVHYGLTLYATLLVPLPRVVTFYGSDVNTRVERRLSRLVTRGVARRVYVSRRLATTMNDAAADVLPNGVDLSVFTPGDRPAARLRFGVGEDEHAILFGGGPENEVKGYDVFEDVLGVLRGRGSPVLELILTTPGQPRSDVVAKLDAADCLLFTSRYRSEGSPTVVKEAAAMGLPIVTVDVGDVSEILAGVAPGSIVAFPEPWGSDAARAELVRALADATAGVLAAGSRSNGRERTDWLDLRRVAERTISLYREVLGR
jgi:glycosyltransferase involved in cell wall biosynthesis